jgi:hypothetical protein
MDETRTPVGCSAGDVTPDRLAELTSKQLGCATGGSDPRWMRDPHKFGIPGVNLGKAFINMFLPNGRGPFGWLHAPFHDDPIGKFLSALGQGTANQEQARERREWAEAGHH